jgi:simple sugar transport system permease protein
MTTVGFRLRVVGANESAARRVGISTTRLSAGAVVASGAVAGVAGSSLILDSLTGSLNEGFASGYGFLGIAVALLARNNPVGCIVSALLFAAMQQGGAQVETQVGVPSASVEIAQGLVIMFVALSAWLLVYLGRRRPEKGLSLEVEGSV